MYMYNSLASYMKEFCAKLLKLFIWARVAARRCVIYKMVFQIGDRESTADKSINRERGKVADFC